MLLLYIIIIVITIKLTRYVGHVSFCVTLLLCCLQQKSRFNKIVHVFFPQRTNATWTHVLFSFYLTAYFQLFHYFKNTTAYFCCTIRTISPYTGFISPALIEELGKLITAILMKLQLKPSAPITKITFPSICLST